jgi:hypothetical protein
MCPTFDPFRLLVISVAGWLGQRQRDAIDYLREENPVPREQLGDRRLRLNDDQRRRLAARARGSVATFGRRHTISAFSSAVVRDHQPIIAVQHAPNV